MVSISQEDLSLMRVGITGHQHLHHKSDWAWVAAAITDFLIKIKSELVGISSLATGADSVFAEIVLQLNGQLYVVIPFANYEMTFRSNDEYAVYRTLLDSAAFKEILPAKHFDEESYFVAGKRVVDLSEVVVAVWDGLPAAGLGGTGDIVKYAFEIGRHVYHINPVSKAIVK